MKIKKIYSALMATAVIASGSIAANAISVFTPLTQTAQAATYCKDRSFTARALFKVNVRADRSTSSRIVKVLNVGTYTFNTWEIGQSVNDSWTGKPDNMWYRLADGSGWVASAVISGYPPTGVCNVIPPVSSIYKDPLKGKGTISQTPGGRYSHTGRAQYAIDFGTPIGTPVYAMRSGKVTVIKDGFPDTGGGESNANRVNYVMIQYSDGFRSSYLHLQRGFSSRTGIRIGQEVQTGQLIGYSGNSGWSTNPHLHVEVHRVNPNGTAGQTVPFRIEGRF
jgi:murein DD-endopeptidase MepM/ murein hydrolase activator NlpD